MSLELLEELEKAIEETPRRHTAEYLAKPSPPPRKLTPKQKIPLSSEEIRLIYYLIFRKVSRTNLKICLRHIIDQLQEYYNQL